MALNIGTLVGYLSLDDTNFNRKADAADRKINALKLHLDALKATNPKISVEVDAETAKLDELKAKIADLKIQAAKGVDVKVEMTQAMIELDRVQTKLRDLHNKEVKVKVDVDDKAAVAKVDALDARLSALQSKIRGSGGPGWMKTGIFGLGPALLPTLTAATGGVLALGSGAVAAAGGIGVLKLAFHGLSAEVQAYQKYQQAMGLATTAKQRQAAQLALDKSAYGTGTSASQDMTQFLVDKGVPAFQQLQQRAQSATFPGVTKGLRDLIALLPVADRLVWRLGSAMGGMAANAGHALKDPFWTHWFTWLGKMAKTDLPIIGSILGHTFEGIARAVQRFSPQGTSLLHWIDDLAKKFDQWTTGRKGSSFESFMKQVPQDAKAVMGVLRPLGSMIKDFGAGLQSFGVEELKGLGWGLAQIARIPPGPFRLLGEAIGPFFLALKGIGLARAGVAGLVGAAGALSKIKGFGGLAGKLGGTVAGEVGGVTLGKGVVPVYVTNKGFGGAGGGGLPGDLGKAGGGLAAGVSTTIAAAAAGALAIYFGSKYGSNKGQVNSNATGDYIHQQMALNGQNYVGSPYGSRGYVNGTYVPQAIRGADYSGAKKAAQDYATTVVAAMATANRATAKYRTELLSLPKKVQTAVQNPGAIQSFADIQKLKQQYDLTPKQVRTVINLLGGPQAIATAEAIQQKIDALHSKDITVRVNEIHAVAFGPHAKATKQATGGHITGPGTGTSDSIPARLSNGEYVIRAAAVKRYGVGLFDALNAERFASGGRVHRRHHHLTSKQHAALLRQLAAAQKVLGRTDTTIGNALSFGQAFAGNVFGAGLPTTKDITVPGKTFTEVINGQTVTESTPATTKTVKLSQAQILAEMMRYQKGQLAQARQVERDVKRLRREGVSRSLLAQMQAGGAQGIAEIHALAQGSRAQVHQFNRLNAATTSALNNAGAHAVANSAMATLQRQKANEEATVRAIRKAIRDGVPVVVTHSSKLRKV